MKNLCFLSNLAETLSPLTSHEVVLLTKFQDNCVKIVDFSSEANFGPVSFFMQQSLGRLEVSRNVKYAAVTLRAYQY